MAKRKSRRFWERTVGELERSGAPHVDIAKRHGVRVGTLRHWIYRLKRERRAADAHPAEVRLLPVEVVTSASRAQTIEVRASGGDILVRISPNVNSHLAPT